MTEILLLIMIIAVSAVFIIAVNKFMASSFENRKRVQSAGLKVFMWGLPFLFLYVLFSIARIVGLWK